MFWSVADSLCLVLIQFNLVISPLTISSNSLLQQLLWNGFSSIPFTSLSRHIAPSPSDETTMTHVNYIWYLAISSWSGWLSNQQSVSVKVGRHQNITCKNPLQWPVTSVSNCSSLCCLCFSDTAINRVTPSCHDLPAVMSDAAAAHQWSGWADKTELLISVSVWMVLAEFSSCMK